MSDDLKPCPFCTAEAAKLSLPTCNEKSAYNPADRAYPIVRCDVCGAEVPGENWDHVGNSAVAAWNRRPATPEVVTTDMAATAMQEAWDEFCNDANAIPDCIQLLPRRRVSADFRVSNFAGWVATNLNAALSSPRKH